MEKKKRIITQEAIEEFENFLCWEEKAENTVKKYVRDIGKLFDFLDGRELDKQVAIDYKKYLVGEDYEVSSLNSFLTASNQFFRYMEWEDLRLSCFKEQKETLREEGKCLFREEYFRLIKTAWEKKKWRLARMMQTIASMGLRVCELCFVTVERVQRGILEIRNKGKVRWVPVPENLQKILLDYAKKAGIQEGILFRTSGGKPVDRSNFWKEMKSLCKKAKVESEKVFPHNLRHLFAREFYAIEKDIAKLANILGHSNIQTTRLYVKETIREQREQMEKVDLVMESHLDSDRKNNFSATTTPKNTSSCLLPFNYPVILLPTTFSFQKNVPLRSITQMASRNIFRTPLFSTPGSIPLMPVILAPVFSGSVLQF